MTRLSAFWGSVLLLVASGIAVADPVTSPRRMMTETEQENWAAVGRLNVSGQGYCTATLVAPDAVLTAAHCLVNKRTGRVVSAEKVHFLPGFRKGTYAAHGRAVSVALLPGYSRAQQTVHTDIALVRLKDRLPPDIIPIPLAASPLTNVDLTTLSYGIDRSQIPSIEVACQTERRRGPVLYTNCDGVPGVSGAPVVQVTEEGPQMVAVASAVLGQPDPRSLPKGKLVAVATSRDAIAYLTNQLGLDALIPVYSSAD